MMERGLANPKLKNFYIDISWTEMAKYVVATPEIDGGDGRTSINRYPDRFLFGTDEVAPTEQGKYLTIYDIYQPLLREADARGEAETPQGQLRAAVRRGAPQGEGVGEGAREETRDQGLGAAGLETGYEKVKTTTTKEPYV